MAFRINLKVNGIDEWVDLPISSYSYSNDSNQVIQTNANGQKSYLSLGANISSVSMNTSIMNGDLGTKITNYLKASGNKAYLELDILGIRYCDVTVKLSKTSDNLLENCKLDIKVEIVNE